jgi:hypothetical protein
MPEGHPTMSWRLVLEVEERLMHSLFPCLCRLIPRIEALEVWKEEFKNVSSGGLGEA